MRVAWSSPRRIGSATHRTAAYAGSAVLPAIDATAARLFTTVAQVITNEVILKDTHGTCWAAKCLRRRLLRAGGTSSPTVRNDAMNPDFASLLRLDGQVHVVVGAGQGIGLETAYALASVGAKVMCVDVDASRSEAVAADTADPPPPATLPWRERSSASCWKRRARSLRAVESSTSSAWCAGKASPTRPTTTGRGRTPSWRARRVERCELPCRPYGAPAAARSLSSPRFRLSQLPRARPLRHVEGSTAVDGANGRCRIGTRGNTSERRLAWSYPYATVDIRSAVGRASPRERPPHAAPQARRTSDIAGALVFLSSRLAGQITGHNLTVDGGLTLTWPVATPGGE
jgi:hypothetical protein